MRVKESGHSSYGTHPSYDAHEDFDRGMYRHRGTRSFGSDWGYGEMSASSYNGLIGGILLYGFLVNVLLAKFCTPIFLSINPIVLIIGYFILAITGIIISRRSENPYMSFLGYNLVVLPLGVILSICLVGQTSVSIINAGIVTVGVTFVMLIASTLKPDLFLSMGRALGIALLAVIIIEVICMLFGVFMPTFWDFLVALIFCGYIGYDWAKAQQSPHTPDCAVDACVDLYLDIVNLFIRLLSIMGRHDSD